MPPAQATNGRGPPAHPDELRPAQRPPTSTRPPQPDWTQHERGPASGPPHVGRQPAALPSASPPRTEPAPRADSALAPKAVDNAAFDAKSLLAEVPKRMRAGKPVTVAVRVPRHQLEAWSSGGADAAAASRQVITKAMMMRLKAAPSDFAVENASPETQWSEGYQGPLSDDIVSWRWIVKPRRSGRHSLHLNGATRIVGRDGLAAERPLPPQRVTVRVSPDYIGVARRATVLLLIAATAGALGYFADGLYDLGRSALAQLVR